MRIMGFGTIFFIVVTVIVLYQLRSVLGRRTGNERPPFDPYTRPEVKNDNATPSGNVVTLPSRRTPANESVEPARPYEAIDKAAAPGTVVNEGMRRIRDADPSFDPAEFLGGVRTAYEMIVTGFADGDRKLLKNLLSQEVYSGFETAIAEREKRGERMQFSFVGIEDAKITGAELRDREAFVTVEIVSQIISAVVGANGETVEGDPEAVVQVQDVWTFARDVRSRDPNWKLVETESEDAGTH
ncbi:Tim44/TimA family putative adaptor protein [Mangrovicella endophytica]|uniref:Tim44/TimA family putative adaptor protein n=1 Tax=Mangrovicella endophytica TaxID=2066697 RepID=UPI003CC92341